MSCEICIAQRSKPYYLVVAVHTMPALYAKMAASRHACLMQSCTDQRQPRHWLTVYVPYMPEGCSRFLLLHIPTATCLSFISLLQPPSLAGFGNKSAALQLPDATRWRKRRTVQVRA